MKFCEKCRVYVPSTREHCPLCQGRLTQAQDNGQPHYDDEIFPYLPTIYHQHNLLIRVALFVSVAACVLCLALNFLLTPHNWWSLFVLAGWGRLADGGAGHPQAQLVLQACAISGGHPGAAGGDL